MRNKQEIRCDGCGAFETIVLKALPMAGDATQLIACKPPRGWWVGALFVPAEDRPGVVQMTICVCPSCVEKKVVLGEKASGVIKDQFNPVGFSQAIGSWINEMQVHLQWTQERATLEAMKTAAGLVVTTYGAEAAQEIFEQAKAQVKANPNLPDEGTSKLPEDN